jgi:hypothetical protein
VQTAGLLFQRRSIRDAQSKWRVGAGPVTAVSSGEAMDRDRATGASGKTTKFEAREGRCDDSDVSMRSTQHFVIPQSFQRIQDRQ